MTLTPIVETCMTSESLERLDIEAQSDEIFDAEIVQNAIESARPLTQQNYGWT